MSIDKAVNAYFVTTASGAVSESLKQDFATAFTYLRNHIPEDHIREIKASEGYPLIASGQLSKKDIFVFDRFEGDFFKQLQQTRSLIVGPHCLISCLLKCESIPLGTSPVYTMAMSQLQISATGITPQEKDRVCVLIQWMGGQYLQNYGRSVTHLISNTIKSTKYENATLNGIPVMHVDWVQRVWERSGLESVSATDEEFEKYRLPIFFGTNITCTGLGTEKKDEVMRLVNENGGTYHRAFRSQLVDIVITEKTETHSDKYKAAVRYKKDILLPEWIFESVQKGFALPTKAYQVKALKVSTPTRNDQTIADFTSTDHTQLSDISRISNVGAKRGCDLMTTVNDTMCSGLNETQQPPPAEFIAPPPPAPTSSKNTQHEALKKRGSEAHYRLIYDDISPKEAKKAGHFLDGCCIYLSGFQADEREKLNRILNVGGATRYDVVNEKITHIIVGQLDDAEFRTWRKDGLLASVHILRLNWLLESIRIKQAANELVYRVSIPTSLEPDAPSPTSKRTLRSMNHCFKQPEKPIKKNLFDASKEVCTNETDLPVLTPIASSTELPLEDEEQDLIAQYSQEHISAAVPLPTLPANNNLEEPVPRRSFMQSTLNDGPVPPIVRVQSAAPLQPIISEQTDIGLSTIDYENLDFFRGMSLYIDRTHFPEEFYSQMIQECEAAQGNVVTSVFRDLVDYAIVSFERTVNVADLPVKARHVITELYVESCLKENKIVPIEYYHRPVPHTASSLPLKGMTIVISTYSGLERDFIDSVAQLLGATVNKTFVKKEKPLLICPVPEGSKYEGAIKWCYPVVTSDWLIQCAVQGVKLSYHTYLVGESPEDFPLSPTLRERNFADTVKSPAQASPLPLETNAKNSTEYFTPLRNKRVSELAGPGRNSITHAANTTELGSMSDSPHTPVNSHLRPSYNFDFMEKILAEIEDEDQRECLREVIIEMRNNQTPELERIRRQACTPINRKIPTPKGIPDFCTTPEFEKRMADEFERRWRLPTKKIKPDTPIDELRRRVIFATCKALGIPFSDDEEHASTSAKKQDSVPTQKRVGSILTPVNAKAARTSEIIPRSIFVNDIHNMSNASTSDTFIPGTQTPTTSGLHTSGMGKRASLVGKSTINFDKISFEDTEVGAASRASAAAATTSPEMKQITEYLKNCESRRQTMKRSATRGNEQHQSGNEMMETEGHYVQPFESEQFGAGTEEMVGWRDPVEFDKERRSKTVPSMQHKGTPRFSISCANGEAREDTIKKILQLGGMVSENLVNFDPACTHFVCERPNRGEKILGCLSSGKWILSLKYIEESFAKDVFVDEESFEWGNCKALNLPELTADEKVIAQAAHRWRKTLSTASNSNTGAFTGFQAILHTHERSLEALKNVLKAGNGKIIEATPPYSESNGAHMATHCFVDIKKKMLSPESYKFLQDRGVKVFTQMYINAYLMNGKDVDSTKYEVNM